jgi:hypothetical protein
MSKVEKEAEDGKKALAYHGAVPMVVYGLGEKNIRVARTILAAKGYFTLNMRDIADMGVEPPDLGKFHPDDWGSNDGKHKTKSEYWLTVWIHTSKKGCTQEPQLHHGPSGGLESVKFLGGERAKPGEQYGALTFALGRAPVGEDGWEPSYPAAFLLPTLGTVPGAQQLHGDRQHDAG